LFSPLKIELKPSKRWYTFVISAHLVALLSVLFLTPLEPFVRSLLAISLLLSGYSFFRFPINQGVSAFIWNADQRLFATQSVEGNQTQHEMPKSLLVFPFLVCLKLRASAPIASQWLILLPDMMSKDEWRRLQVLSRWSELDA
jgi:hypothetical protein